MRGQYQTALTEIQDLKRAAAEAPVSGNKISLCLNLVNRRLMALCFWFDVHIMQSEATVAELKAQIETLKQSADEAVSLRDRLALVEAERDNLREAATAASAAAQVLFGMTTPNSWKASLFLSLTGPPSFIPSASRCGCRGGASCCQCEHLGRRRRTVASKQGTLFVWPRFTSAFSFLIQDLNLFSSLLTLFTVALFQLF